MFRSVNLQSLDQELKKYLLYKWINTSKAVYFHVFITHMLFLFRELLLITVVGKSIPSALLTKMPMF